MKKYILIIIFFTLQLGISKNNKIEKITFIGDSIMDMGKKYIAPSFKGGYFDTKIGRQFYSLPEIIENLKKQNVVSNIVIIGLGTNGPFNDKEFDLVIEMLGDRDIFFINTVHKKKWEKEVNEKLKKKTSQYKNVYLINIYDKLNGKKQYFRSDGVHLTEQGSKYYADIVIESINTHYELEKNDDELTRIIKKYYDNTEENGEKDGT